MLSAGRECPKGIGITLFWTRRFVMVCIVYASVD